MSSIGDQRSGVGQFLAEMRRRRVVRFVIGYAAVAFVMLQLAEIVFPAFGIGEGGVRLLVVVVTLAFLPALVLAWIYDVTREGIKRTEDRPAGRPFPRYLTHLAFALTAIGVTGGAGWYLVDQGVIGTGDFAATGGAYDPSVPIRSVAVLPLADFSPEGGQAYFAAGMHEELIAQLSTLEDVRVVSRTTVMGYAGTTLSVPEIGRELGVDVLLEGSVNRSGDQVRITLQVIHAPSDSHIATLRFEREAGDVLALQSEVAVAVAQEIAASGRTVLADRTAANVSPAAQEAYFRGKYEYDRGTEAGYRAALVHFEEAVEADPDFGQAMAGLASARFLLGLENPESGIADLERARDEAASAVEMDSRSTEVQEVLAMIERSMPRVMGALPPPRGPDAAGDLAGYPDPDPDPALEALDTAWIAAVSSLGRRIEERVRTRTMRAPGTDGARGVLDARLLMASGRFREAARELEAVVARAPETPAAWERLARSYVASGRLERATATVRRWSEAGGSRAPDPSDVRDLTEAVRSTGERGYWSWWLERLQSDEAAGLGVARIELAAAHAALGQREEAFLLLDAAVEAGERGLLALPADPVWDRLRGDARFREVERYARLMRFAPALRSQPDEGRAGNR